MSKRNAIIHSLIKKESILKRLVGFVIAAVSFLTIDQNYGFMGALNNEWLALAMAFLCIFIPIRYIGLVLFVFLTIHLMAFSIGVCIIFVVLWVLFFVLSKMSGAKNYLYLTLITVLFALHVPFLCPLYEGFFGRKREGITLLGGAIIAFFFRSIKVSESAFTTNNDSVDAFEVLRDNMLSNTNFYTFIIAVCAMFLLINLLKSIGNKGAWYIALAVGVLVEVMVMALGYVFTNSSSQAMTLVISNLVTLLVGLIFALLFSDIKVNRQRVLDFEDDDFEYHVICTPKVRVEETQKKIVKITRSKKELEQEEMENLEKAIVLDDIEETEGKDDKRSYS